MSDHGPCNCDQALTLNARIEAAREALEEYAWQGYRYAVIPAEKFEAIVAGLDITYGEEHDYDPED